MPSKLDQLKAMTTVVADTGDIEAIRDFKPIDCTTNPTLILKAAQMQAYAPLVDEAIAWGRKGRETVGAVADRLAINFGVELAKIVPGRVSTEIDADLSFDIAAMVEKARSIIAGYESRGVARERILIKLAATWEGARAAEILRADKIDCNMTLVFCLPQARICAEAGAFLISPFVGRILDWHVKNSGQSYTSETDPGVLSVQSIYNDFKSRGISTLVMGASFRNLGEIEALAGCDRLTIAPALLDALSKDAGALPRKLDASLIAAASPEAPLDEKTFRYALNSNAMATEKLGEGIRLFSADLSRLRELVTQRLG